MTRVFVTGASGFIGQATVRALEAAGHHAVPLTREAPSRGATPSPLGPDVYGAASLDWHDTSVLVHLGWYTAPADYLTSDENTRSLLDSLVLVDAALAAGVRRVVMLGSCAEYAPTQASTLLDEGAPIAPRTRYGAHKAAARLLVQQRCDEAGAQLAWGRLFQPYGPGERRGRLVPEAVATLLDGQPFLATAGEQVRDFVFVDDVGRAISHLATATSAAGSFNICSGQGVSIRDLLTLLADIVGRPDLLRIGARPSRHWDPPFLVGDPRRLRDTGFSPSVTLEEGLRRSVPSPSTDA